MYIHMQYVYNRWMSPLKDIPGEWHAYLTSAIYWLHALKGDKPVYMQHLHREHGPFVRAGKLTGTMRDRI
jgi:hypothetical protein